MKDFFTQCMEDLFALTGIEQVRWMQSDMKNGKHDFELCVSAMVEVSKKFSYISEADQQTVIRKMMVEDKQYKGLNSRTIWGWLDLHKDVYYRGQTHFDEPEVNEADLPSKEKVAEYVKQWQEAMTNIGQPDKVNGIKKLREEMGTFINGKDAASYLANKKTFIVNEIEIRADTQEEAQKMYDETFN